VNNLKEVSKIKNKNKFPKLKKNNKNSAVFGLANNKRAVIINLLKVKKFLKLEMMISILRKMRIPREMIRSIG
jgi:hypothetical protein